MSVIEEAVVEVVQIRSVLTCETVGVCAPCYGRDLARGTPVNMVKRSVLWPRSPSVNRAHS